MKKENKNTGFTLIELLAVIVIMGVLMMAAIPAITNAITRSRKSTFASNAKELINSVRTTISSGDAVRTGGETGICQFPPANKEVRVSLTKKSISYLLERGGTQSSFGQEYGTSDDEEVGAVFIVNKGSTSGGGEFYDYYIFLKDTGGNGVANSASGGVVAEDDVSRAYVQVGTLAGKTAPTYAKKSGPTQCTISTS